VVEPTPDGPFRVERLPRALAFVVSAAVAAASLRFAWYRPGVAAALLAGLAAFFVARWLSRRRVRRLLLSGDVDSVLTAWSGSLDRVPHPATMGPLMTATALAAYGRVARARAALASAERGPAWEAALEHRLFVDTLLLTFEGDRDGALASAGRMARLPLPERSAAMQGRIRLLRGAIGAFARAFAHTSRPGDRAVLELASRASPLVSWAMRYAAAVVAIDHGDLSGARGLVAGAPEWPAESALRAFHQEIASHVGLTASTGGGSAPSAQGG
jgi:hypothetical protein